MKQEYLFVYGTLREGAGHPMHEVLRRHATAAGPAGFRGKLFDLGPYPAVVPGGSGRSLVRGELYRLPNPEPVLRRLDKYEGCAPEDPPPHPYRREKHPVITQDGGRATAWIYLYNGSVAAAAPIASGDYLECPRQRP